MKLCEESLGYGREKDVCDWYKQRDKHYSWVHKDACTFKGPDGQDVDSENKIGKKLHLIVQI